MCTLSDKDLHSESVSVPLHFQNNTFQVAVATDNGNTVAVFNYLDGGLNWYQADEDYYDYTEDDPEISPVQVGFNKGGEDEIFYTLSGFTLTPEVLNLDEYSNRDKPGQWTFSIGNENVTTGEPTITGAGTPGNNILIQKLSMENCKHIYCAYSNFQRSAGLYFMNYIKYIVAKLAILFSWLIILS